MFCFLSTLEPCKYFDINCDPFHVLWLLVLSFRIHIYIYFLIYYCLIILHLLNDIGRQFLFYFVGLSSLDFISVHHLVRSDGKSLGMNRCWNNWLSDLIQRKRSPFSQKLTASYPRCSCHSFIQFGVIIHQIFIIKIITTPCDPLYCSIQCIALFSVLP